MVRWSVCYFNVYLADYKWTWVDEFWAASNYGLPVGGIAFYPAGKMYDKAVRIKRMA